MERCGRQVLVVEDDVCARDLLAQLLIRAGYEVREASNGVEALHELVQQHYDVIITDYRMPGRINGLELMRLSRQVWPETPVVLVTGESPSMLGPIGQGVGCAYIQKPYDASYLLDTVQAVVGQVYAKSA
ncbi:MAG: response regulator [Nitrospiraceae bacterium]